MSHDQKESSVNRKQPYFDYIFWFVDFLFLWGGRVSLHHHGFPGTLTINKAGLELTELHLPLHSKGWGSKVCTSTLGGLLVLNLK